MFLQSKAVYLNKIHLTACGLEVFKREATQRPEAALHLRAPTSSHSRWKIRPELPDAFVLLSPIHSTISKPALSMRITVGIRGIGDGVPTNHRTAATSVWVNRTQEDTSLLGLLSDKVLRRRCDVRQFLS